VRRDFRKRFYGLTFWSPNINIFRDPRWGRGQETYGEDPYLTSRLGVAFVRGLQGDDPKYLKTVATPKHYAVHSGPESRAPHLRRAPARARPRRHVPPGLPRDVVEGKAGSVMCAYNRMNGEPLCASPRMLKEILRGEWGFSATSSPTATPSQTSTRSTTSEDRGGGVARRRQGRARTLTCGYEYRALPSAVKQGLITEAEIDTAVKRLFEARFRLGMFDPPESVPYARIPFSKRTTRPRTANWPRAPRANQSCSSRTRTTRCRSGRT
jgi:beta-glucosidase